METQKNNALLCLESSGEGAHIENTRVQNQKNTTEENTKIQHKEKNNLQCLESSGGGAQGEVLLENTKIQYQKNSSLQCLESSMGARRKTSGFSTRKITSCGAWSRVWGRTGRPPGSRNRKIQSRMQ